MEQNAEKIIGKIIYNYFSVEWIRFNMYLSENIYTNIPVLVFRLREDVVKEQVKELKECVANFEGEMKWKVFKNPLSKTGNYLLTIAIMEEIRKECYEKGIIYNERKILGIEKYKLYCERAVHDIPLLAKHIEYYFGKIK